MKLRLHISNCSPLIELYALALQRATGLPVRAIVLEI
jgi:hypothetical protein